MNGLHLIADLHDCRCATRHLLDADSLEQFCVEACTAHGLTVVGRLFHSFHDEQGQAAGVTGAVVLAESHLTLHTWPELAAVTLDLYVCNFSGDNTQAARQLFDKIIASFAADRLETKEVARGHLSAKPVT